MRTAFILAAGLGTRLRPLTDTMPKAMVPYHGTPMIESLLHRLHDAGFRRVVINLHHFGEMLRDFVLSLGLEGMEILFSDESGQLLNTGGALKHAAPLLSGSGPILVHNVDIITNLDLEQFYTEGCEAMTIAPDTGAILVASPRETSRYLLFDEQNKLQGWMNLKDGKFRSTGAGYAELQELRPEQIPAQWSRKAFSGIHLISPEILPLMTPFPDVFSIIDFYLSIADTCPVQAYTPEGLTVTDIGKLDTLGLK